MLEKTAFFLPPILVALCVAGCTSDGDSENSSGPNANSAGNGTSGSRHGEAGSSSSAGRNSSAGQLGSAAGEAGMGEAGGGSGNTGGSPGTGGVIEIPENVPLIVVDQFGYRPSAEKVAVIRDPRSGFDAGVSFTPSDDYALVDTTTGEAVFTGSPLAWNGGAVDESSGDAAWWFDFSSVTASGSYVVHDRGRDVRSAEFDIAPDVYREVLQQAVRAYFYQRAGFDKEASFAGEAWADEASHVGPLQDANCRLHSAPDDASTERDLHGGWYDAGDYNKYTAWHARYIIALLRAYRHASGAFGDDSGIPESGNGEPDIIDEVRFGIEWLERMQNDDGSLLSIVGLAHGSPPSAATDPSYYGPPNTIAALAGASAFAYAARAFAQLGDAAYADALLARAESAWTWAEQNPGVIFRNNDSASGSSGLGAGQQETDDEGRFRQRLEAAVYLFAATGDAGYAAFVDENYEQIHLMQWTYAYPFEMAEQESLLEYAALPNATASVSAAIRATYAAAVSGSSNLGAHQSELDPYLAYLQDYVWGSNSTKANQGLIFTDAIDFGVDASLQSDALRAAERYIHYLHGVNPLGLVYLSNMGDFGAESSVTELYHSWFTNGSSLWDSTETSTHGPAPGFLVGGPNPSYSIDVCCPDSCGSSDNNALCASDSLQPPLNQPPQKSYKDFNDAWPLNSWAVTENSNGYQAAYIRLLAKFVE